MSQQLKPITGTGKKKERKFAVCDIEVDNWVNFLCIGYYDGYTKKFVWFDDIGKFLDFVFDHCTQHDIASIFAHFGGKFDFNFIIREAVLNNKYMIKSLIPRSSSILCFDLYQVDENEDDIRKWKKITFRDSSALLPYALRTLTTTFDVETKKGTIDYSKMGLYWKSKSGRKKVISYLRDDNIGLWQVIHKFYSMPLIEKAGPAFTTASQAMRVFQTFMPKGSTISSLGDEADTFVRRGYFGGRTEVFRPIFDSTYDIKNNPDGFNKVGLAELKKQKKAGKIEVYDVNSLFPSEMKGNDYPTHFDKMTFYKEDYDKKGLGFWEVTVRVPKKMFCPPLGVKYILNGAEKLIFPTGTFRGVWSIAEIEYAKKIGVKIIKYHKGAIFKNGGKIFDEFVTTLYNKRLEAKNNNDSASSMLYKLILNSCYGKFGQVTKDKEQLIIDDGRSGIVPDIEIDCDDGRKIGLAREKTDIRAFTNVGIAAYVTAYSRIAMHKLYLKAGEEHLYYTDTDSIFVTKKFKHGKNLGELDLEYTRKRACFLLPKTYMLDDGDDTVNKKVAMKGFDNKKIQHFTFNDFRECLHGDLDRLKIVQSPKFATLRTALRKGEFVCMAFDPTTEEIVTQKRLKKTIGDIAKYEMLIASDTYAEHDFDERIKKLKNKKRSLEKKLSAGFEESTRSIQSYYDKRICTPDGFFSKPIHIGG
jgi:hypothetical protein